MRKILTKVAILSLLLVLMTMLGKSDAQAQRRFRRVSTKKVVVIKPGKRVRRLPAKAVVITHRNINYHYAKGVYYRRINGAYQVVQPAYGLRLVSLPAKAVLVANRRTIYHYNGVYYKAVAAGGYEVIEAPELANT
ncbi:DUF6515 family protein [Persicobacter psychrovividus]|uniref:Uncharacterized protein n=1 Tax=Persicobacter psychrovividus TaxID=387638 RepID=A0ABM7VI85_9BACT|nr:hypothetical protein PEPS_29650 [Persicobacter psychrovividus]